MANFLIDAPVPPLPTRRWLTPDEAAAWLGVSRATLDRARRDGKIEPSRVLGDPRYDIQALDKMMLDGLAR